MRVGTSHSLSPIFLHASPASRERELVFATPSVALHDTKRLGGLLQLVARFFIAILGVFPRGKHGRSHRILHQEEYPLSHLLVVNTKRMQMELNNRFGIPWRRVCVLTLLMTAFIGSMQAGHAGERLPGPSERVPLEYFGMHIHNAVDGSPWPPFKFGSWRQWDSRVTWPYIQPERGKWDFSRLDRYMGLAERFGIEMLYPLGLSPRWASARPDEPSGYRPGNMAEPGDLEDWRQFVRMMAARYKGRIRKWEIWNEIHDSKRFFSGSFDIMVQMAGIAYQELKAADSGNFVLTPSFTGPYRESLDALDRYLRLGGGKNADVLSYHFYLLQGRRPEELRSYVASVRAVLDRNGLARMPIWNSESGFRIVNADGAPEVMKLNDSVWPKHDVQRGADYTARSLIVGWMSGLKRFYWYAWDNAAYGLMEPHSKQPKAAAMAYGQVTSWLTGKVVEHCDIGDNQTWICELVAAGGAKAWIVWNAADREGTAPLRASDIATIVEVQLLNGIVSAFEPRGTTLPASGSPVLYSQRGFAS
jgi:hypothetical protein